MASLETTPLPTLLLTLHRDEFSGELELRRDRIVKRFRFQRGAPVQVESSLARESLRELLASRALLEPRDVERLTRGPGGAPGKELAAIAALQVVPPKQLLMALRDQVRSSLLDCFSWRTGSFSLQPVQDDGDAQPPLSLDPVTLACEGVAAHWRPDEVLARLGERAMRVAQPAPAFEAWSKRLPRSASVNALVEAFDGRTRTWEALRRAATPEAAAALYVLDALGALSFGDPETPGETGEEAPEGPEIEIVSTGLESGAGPRKETRRETAARGVAEDVAEAEAAALRDQLLDLHRRLAEIDHYELLGVDRDVTPAQVRRAYLKLAKRLHPDGLARLGLGEIKFQANEVFAQVTRAHAVLSDLEQRERYDAALAGETETDAARLVQAEAFFRKGEVLMRAGNYRDALGFLENAVELWPEESEYQSALGWTLFKKIPPELERAAQHLEKAVELAEDAARAHLRLHYVSKARGETARAAAALARAREIDPAVKV